MENDVKKNQSRLGGVAVRALAIFGFLAIIIVGMWGSVQVARGVPNAFSSLASAVASFTSVFIPAGEKITLSTASFTLNSNEPFTISWRHDKKSLDGSYTFRYDCADAVYFNSPTISGTPATIYCNTSFNFLNSGNQITLIPVSSNNRFVDVQVFIDFTPNGASRPTVTGQTTFTIVNNGNTTSPGTLAPATTTPTTVTPKPVTPTPVTPRPVTPGPTQTGVYPVTGGVAVSDPNGYVDLTARIIEVGIVDKTTGVFTASSTPTRANNRIAVRFAVENIGTKTSPTFDFNAVLPTLPSNIFSAPMQQSLAPGDRIEFTVGFDSFNSSKPDGLFVVNIDPSNRINERNKVNNIVQYTITTRP
ncbi:MAG: CARDB domain-containing protein [Patescibacteria group bacterium]